MSTVLFMETRAVFGRTSQLNHFKRAQFAVVLGYYWLLCRVDRTILAPLFSYQGLAYRSASGWTQISVLGLILLCTPFTPARYRQPSDGMLYMLLPLVPQRPQADHGPSRFVGLTVR